MHLLTGPAGSGKTFVILEQLRAALRRKDDGVRLLVPTATMAQHFQNELAREGFVFSPSLIQTIHRYIEPWVGDLPEASSGRASCRLPDRSNQVNCPRSNAPPV